MYVSNVNLEFRICTEWEYMSSLLSVLDAERPRAYLLGYKTEVANCTSRECVRFQRFIELDSIIERLANIDEEYKKRDYKLKAHLLGNLP